MGAHIARVVAAALVLILWRGGVEQGKATVIRDSRGGPANPTVEAGGHHLPPAPPPPVPYSFIGPVAAEGRWYAPCLVWPWRVVGSFTRPRHGARAGIHAASFGKNQVNRPPRP
jgi:hypothetical protein